MSDTEKRIAAAAALERVKPGMVLGLGTGSTAAIFLRLLAERVREGLDIVGTPTSDATERLANELGIRLIDADATKQIDLAIDGADEFDSRLRLIKGGGAALLREKIIADASDHMIVIADRSKEVSVLGRFPLPVEINPFGAELTRRRVLQAVDNLNIEGAEAAWRMATPQTRLRTDGGHLILDVRCGAIPDPDLLSEILDSIPGVVEHGLFIGIAGEVIVGEESGPRILTPPVVPRM